jgi:hypothetical protein
LEQWQTRHNLNRMPRQQQQTLWQQQIAVGSLSLQVHSQRQQPQQLLRQQQQVAAAVGCCHPAAAASAAAQLTLQKLQSLQLPVLVAV